MPVAAGENDQSWSYLGPFGDLNPAGPQATDEPVLFGIQPDHTELLDGLLMIVEADGTRVGLFVDELMSQQQVVIKSMETNYARIDGVGGATILGEGMVALILDVPGLIRLASERQLRQVA